MRNIVADSDARRRELAKIHILAGELGLDTADRNPASEYRSILWTIGRVHSAGALDQAGRLAVLDHLAQRGRRERRASPAPSYGRKPAVQAELQPLIDKIEALLADSALPWKYAHAIGERMFRVKQLEWLRADQLRGVITALVKRAARPAKAGR